MRSGGEHCHPTLAVEEAEEKDGEQEEEEAEEEEEAADIKSNNPHLTGGEKASNGSKDCENNCDVLNTCICSDYSDYKAPVVLACNCQSWSFPPDTFADFARCRMDSPRNLQPKPRRPHWQKDLTQAIWRAMHSGKQSKTAKPESRSGRDKWFAGGGNVGCLVGSTLRPISNRHLSGGLALFPTQTFCKTI